MFILLTTAGNETTRHTISLGLVDLLAHPDELERLVADPSLARRPPTRSSAARIRCTTSAAPRRGTSSLHGRRIRRGDKVTIWYAAANYDERQFADPYRLDVGRAPNRHVTFGLGGPHFCLGAHLAKLEITRLARGDGPVPRRGSSWQASRCGYARTSSTASSACPCGWRA